MAIYLLICIILPGKEKLSVRDGKFYHLSVILGLLGLLGLLEQSRIYSNYLLDQLYVYISESICYRILYNRYFIIINL